MSLNQDIKVMKATANITPGIAYPDMEKADRQFNSLLLDTLFPQFDKKENIIKQRPDKETSKRVLKLMDHISMS